MKTQATFTEHEMITAYLIPGIERYPYKNLTCVSIIDWVERYYELPKNALLHRTRKTDVRLRRQISMYLCYAYTGNPLWQIGQAHNGFDHATVIHAARTICNFHYSTPYFRREIDELLVDFINVTKAVLNKTRSKHIIDTPYDSTLFAEKAKAALS